ncbi:MAG: hypothetical protein IH607_04620 [Firmicutes bacterium]|nr:hypothetical protein [Bacillota bacterium]
MIRKYSDFVAELLKAGFSMGGGADDGIYSVVTWSWNETPPYETPVRWHTGDLETDPWEWRMRVLEERNDIAYSKLFFKKSGYITKDWYPYFLAVRRQNLSFEEAYDDGIVTNDAKRLYEVVKDQGPIALHSLKVLSNLAQKDQKSRFDRAMTELQTKLFITMCARQQKQSKTGEGYGWYSTVFTTVEDFFPAEVFKKAASLSKKEAAEQLTKQILTLNPQAKPKIIENFIQG